MCNDMIYCQFCNTWNRKDYVHVCTMNYYICAGCGQYVHGTHICSGNVTYGYCQVEPKHYKCPDCKGEFSEPVKRFTGKYKDEDIKELGNQITISTQKVPIYEYVCPFCRRELKGLNQ